MMRGSEGMVGHRRYDAVVIGAGLSGLTAASLLAKRGLHVVVVEKAHKPGGSCGIFKREGAVFDQGSAMLFGFGEQGFNAHRFVMNCLEERLDVVQHELLYTVNFKGQRIRFWRDVEKFADELSGVFPQEREGIHKFYRDMERLYRHVMVENPAYATPDETRPSKALRCFLKHPISYVRFLSYLNKSARSLLEHYFKDPEIFNFFDKMTSTYCYATVEEAPAILAAVMFVDNHLGGSYYPAGSTLFLPGKLEKVIEENGGDMLYGREVLSICFEDGKPAGVMTDKGERILAEDVVYSGTVWNLYGKLIDLGQTTTERILWAETQKPTYPSVVLYAIADRSVIPEGTQPVEMLVGNPERIDESEVTVYIPSIDDFTLCDKDLHMVSAIGPTFVNWADLSDLDYQETKRNELKRLVAVLERRFPGFERHVRYAEMATPRTIERYCLKNGGAVAGPKQMLGQHMFKRLKTRTEWANLFCCGESTVMGTGTPTVTTSGISAANAVLRKRGLEVFSYHEGMENQVRILPPPIRKGAAYRDLPVRTKEIMKLAANCQYCEHPSCCLGTDLDIPGIMRRLSVGNLAGVRKKLSAAYGPELLRRCEDRCVEKARIGRPVEIGKLCKLIGLSAEAEGLK